MRSYPDRTGIVSSLLFVSLSFGLERQDSFIDAILEEMCIKYNTHGMRRGLSTSKLCTLSCSRHKNSLSGSALALISLMFNDRHVMAKSNYFMHLIKAYKNVTTEAQYQEREIDKPIFTVSMPSTISPRSQPRHHQRGADLPPSYDDVRESSRSAIRHEVCMRLVTISND